MEKAKRKYASIFELDGIPQMSKALPLALQHVVAMIVARRYLQSQLPV